VIAILAHQTVRVAEHKKKLANVANSFTQNIIANFLWNMG